MISKDQVTSNPTNSIDRIYSGLITQMVSFLPVQPTICIHPQNILQNISLEGKLDALKTRYPLRYMGKLYQNVVIPCIPAYQHMLNVSLPTIKNTTNLKNNPDSVTNIETDGNIQKHIQKHIQTHISHQQQYYIKTDKQTNTRAIASGKRSAILQSTSPINGQPRLLRYKGCGNQLKGFNMQNNHGVQQTRGHHFYQTSKRQLYMNTMLNRLFRKQLGIHPPANQPQFMFDYSEQFLLANGIANQLPIIAKYCCVYQTKGDRRAGTHLISPMELIFLSVYDQQQQQQQQQQHTKKQQQQQQTKQQTKQQIEQQINQRTKKQQPQQQQQNNKWRQTFLSKGRIDQQNQLIDFVTNFQLFVENGQTFFDAYQISQQMETYITFRDGKFVQKKQTQLDTIYTKLINKYVIEQYKQYCMQQLKSIKDILVVIQIIIDRIGWQIGQIKRTMSKHGISWGFFQDHGKLFHCNAHLNNLIITKPVTTKQSSNYFVLPLDYDLAYTKQQFINIQLQSPTYGQHDTNIFQGYQCAEYNAMQMSLFGVQLMDFKYGIDDGQQQQLQKQKQQQTGQVQSQCKQRKQCKQSKGVGLLEKKMNRIVFRDSLVKSFIQGMRNKVEIKQKINQSWDANIQDIRKFVEVCLIISLGFQT